MEASVDPFGDAAPGVDGGDPFADAEAGSSLTDEISAENPPEAAEPAPPVVDREGQPVATAPDPADPAAPQPAVVDEEEQPVAPPEPAPQAPPEPPSPPVQAPAPVDAPAPPQEPQGPPAAPAEAPAPPAEAPAAPEAPQEPQAAAQEDAAPAAPAAPEGDGTEPARPRDGKGEMRHYKAFYQTGPKAWTEFPLDGELPEGVKVVTIEDELFFEARNNDHATRITFSLLGQPADGVTVWPVPKGAFKPKRVKPAPPRPERTRLEIS